MQTFDALCWCQKRWLAAVITFDVQFSPMFLELFPFAGITEWQSFALEYKFDVSTIHTQQLRYILLAWKTWTIFLWYGKVSKSFRNVDAIVSNVNSTLCCNVANLCLCWTNIFHVDFLGVMLPVCHALVFDWKGYCDVSINHIDVLCSQILLQLFPFAKWQLCGFHGNQDMNICIFLWFNKKYSIIVSNVDFLLGTVMFQIQCLCTPAFMELSKLFFDNHYLLITLYVLQICQICILEQKVLFSVVNFIQIHCEQDCRQFFLVIPLCIMAVLWFPWRKRTWWKAHISALSDPQISWWLS